MAAFKIFRKFADLLDRSTVDLPAINTPLADALAAKAASADLSTVATSGSYADLSGTPTVPTTVAELTDRTTYDFATLNTPLSDALAGKATAAQGALADTAVQNGDSPNFVDVDASGTVTAGGGEFSGNVGVGTASPSAKLHVMEGAIVIPPVSATTMGIFATNGATRVSIIGSAGSIQSLAFGDDSSETDGKIEYANGGRRMSFYTAATEKMIIKSSGEVGIGTTTPTEKLDVVGNITASGTVTAGGATFNGLVSQTGLGNSTYFGESAGIADDLSSNYNVGIGFEALKANTSGNSNTASGVQSLRTNTTGNYNTASGLKSLVANTTGNNNTAIGYSAGRYIADGATANETSGTSVYLGANTKAFADGDANEIVIGYNAIGAGSNSVVLGNDSVTTTVLRGDVETNGTVTTGAYTVSTLPTPTTGMRCYVTDSNVAASGNFGATVAAGGANTVPVFYDGTNWIIA